MSGWHSEVAALERIATALERLSPPPMPAPDFDSAEAFVWHVAPDRLEPVAEVSRIPFELLVGIERARDTLLTNTLQFARGLPANNALLWGARGMGKSSLVKSVHAEVLRRSPETRLRIVEVQREDLPSIGRLLGHLRVAPHRFVLFCDDLSFSHDDQHNRQSERGQRLPDYIVRRGRSSSIHQMEQQIGIAPEPDHLIHHSFLKKV